MARTVDEAAREARPKGDMTPLIDVVFQLIVVFLCSMKFRTLDMKVEADLPPVGMAPRPAEPDTRPRAEVRLRAAGPGAPTRLLLLGIPLGPPGSEEAWTALASRIREIRSRDPGLVGEIDADPDVSHGEVVRALDAFLGASVTEVRFRGAGPTRR